MWKMMKQSIWDIKPVENVTEEIHNLYDYKEDMLWKMVEYSIWIIRRVENVT